MRSCIKYFVVNLNNNFDTASDLIEKLQSLKNLSKKYEIKKMVGLHLVGSFPTTNGCKVRVLGIVFSIRESIQI